MPGALLQVHTISFSLFFYYVPYHQNSLGGNLTNDDHTTVGDALTWKVLVGALPTYAYKLRRQIAVIDDCRLCGAPNDDSFHALISTSTYARALQRERQLECLPKH